MRRTLYRAIQENLIKSSLQNSLSYILLQMVHTSYCVLYPKWLCIKHETNMWCSCCMMSFYSRIFYFLLLSPMMSYASPPVWKTTSPRWCQLWTLEAHLPRQPPFSQHVLWWCCNPPDIPSSTMEILLFNSVFHDGVAPISISTLKPLLGAIGVLPLKPWASPIISVCI